MRAITDEAIGFDLPGHAAGTRALVRPSKAAQPTTAELIEAIAAGDRNALERLYKDNASRMHGVALRILRRRDLTEMIVPAQLALGDALLRPSPPSSLRPRSI